MPAWKFIGFHIFEKDSEILKTIAESRGLSQSAFIRYIVRKELARLSYLPPEDKKALEVIVTDSTVSEHADDFSNYEKEVME